MFPFVIRLSPDYSGVNISASSSELHLVSRFEKAITMFGKEKQFTICCKVLIGKEMDIVMIF